MKIQCRTLFDCSRTNTTGHFRASEVPYRDATGTVISDLATWTVSRNKQRNFETILQMISLRAQPQIDTDPTENNGMWTFEFSVESSGVYSANGKVDNTDALTHECAGTPMIVGLTEKQTLEPVLITQGEHQNIWFESVNS